MRKAHKEKLKGAIGLFLIVLAIAGIFLWEMYGREALTYKEILVCSRDVQLGEVVTKEMLGWMKLDQKALISGRVTEPESIIGMRARNYIPKGLQLSKKFFEEPGLTTGSGSYIFAVPDDWIYTYPQTLRRGDTAFFYAVLKDPESGLVSSETSTLAAKMKVAFVKDSANREVVDVTPDRIDASADAAKIEVVIDNANYECLRNLAASGHQFIIMYE